MEEYVNLFVAKYGYAGIFFSLTLGVIGLPIPDEVLMTYAGYAAARGILSMPLAFASAFCGAALGSTISYGVGRIWGLPLLAWLGPYVGITAARLAKTQGLFGRYGSLLLVVGYFLPGIRHLSAYIGGMSGLNVRRFVLFSFTGAFCWSMTYLQVGLALGKDWLRFVVYARHYGFWLFVMIACIAAGLYVIKKSRLDEP
ncbi:DedA family protein [Brevibacillus sp. TJ4]|uniref:DedA family protein n=1 Tax=Brevibacillus sp. TJ4 TaxID=3234853 RepID=UPI0037D4F26F